MKFTPLPATPHPFTFGGRELYGYMVGFASNVPRRVATHEFPKRDGAIQEDMGAGFRTLETRLVFVNEYGNPSDPSQITKTAAQAYQDFENFVRQNPTGTLIHPIAGQWPAFCTGPRATVGFDVAIDKIEVPISFLESQLDANTAIDLPDVATAAQNSTSQLSQFQQSTALFMARLAKLQTSAAAALNSLDSTISQLTTVATAPVAFAQAQINLALGTASNIVGALATIRAANDALANDVGSFIALTTTLFDGSSDTSPAGVYDSVNNLFGVIQNDGMTLENALTAATATPAGCGDAVMDTETMIEYCCTLRDSYIASRPPTAQYTVVAPINIISLAQKIITDLGLSYDALTYAAQLMGLNRISTPQMIPAGTVLTIITG